MANVEKLKAVLDHIRTNPEEHSQEAWARKYEDDDLPGGCGTTMCFAGTAVVRAGYQLIWDGYYGLDASKCVVPVGGRLESADFGPGEGSIHEVAMYELGLTDEQANNLFYESDTFDDVERTVKDIVNEQTP